MDLSFLDQQNVIAEFQDLIALDSCISLAIDEGTDANVDIQIHKLDASR